MKEQFNKQLAYLKGGVVSLAIDEAVLENGKHVKRDLVAHPGAIAVLPVYNNKVCLVKQFRYALNDYLLEIPAGKLDPSEAPLACMHRELNEETGLESSNIIFLGSHYTAPGFCNEIIHLYLALDCQKVINKLSEDDDEFIDLVLLDLAEVKTYLDENRIHDMKTLAALSAYMIRTQQ